MDPRPFHLLAKPTGAACNLDCSYCFFLSKDQLYPGSTFRMDDEVLEAWLRQLFAAHPEGEVAVSWQGGEPTLMGLDYFRRAVALAERYGQSTQKILYTIQTNATRLDAEWANFFREHNFLVGVSLDGPREVHDRHRVTKGGSGTFDQVLAGYNHLRDAGVAVNILCTVHSDNADDPLGTYRFFRDELGARHLQFIPVVERAQAGAESATAEGWGTGRSVKRPLYTQSGDRAAPRSVGARQYGAFLNGVFDEWVRRDVGTVFVQGPSTWRWAIASAATRCACTRRPAATRSRSSTTATSTAATISWSRATCWATWPKRPSPRWWAPRGSAPSGSRSSPRCPPIAGSATFSICAKAAARRTASSRRPTASRD
jgi:uncharacterized protein